MAQLEEITVGAQVRGIGPDGPVRIASTKWHGSQALEVWYEGADGAPRNRLVYRTDEPTLEVVSAGRAWSFDGDGYLLRLASEAYRIRLAHLFDPYIAIHTSRIEPLPHQITAVYGEMLPRHPLRFLLADDPGAGKTIMAGLLIKELIVRGDLSRCLIVAPGGLVEQWQDELSEKFGLDFDILSRDQIEASRTGNPFEERGMLIARMDMLSRNEELQERLKAAKEWDLVVVDEAHRMSASFFASEIRYTKRYQLGRLLGEHSRHLLLMTATPHNGKEEDFQLFMALIDGDRFEGKFRDGVHVSDVDDLMRRMVKEELVRFDGRPLFPERRAHTVKYQLSPEEAALYTAVTDYVREEMNRADRLAAGDDRRRNNVGFALQILQRRLASSPAAIHESLRRRVERLETRLGEERLAQRGESAGKLSASTDIHVASEDDIDDLEEAPEEEIEDAEEAVLDRATAAQTITELQAEIEILRGLESQALAVRRSGQDTKWRQLDSILDDPLMTDRDGNRRKLIIFTEPKDTLNYLADKIRTRLGRSEAVVVIHGGVKREDRRKAVEAFTQDKDVLVMVANDAAGEGINLQRAHLMVNYDLPWNPNRLEQRFGRIHRIGQTEVCHLWNLVADDTREGLVYARLLEKLDQARQTLGGRVFDVLGRLFEARELRELLFDAIRYGERDDVRARLFEKIDGAVDEERLRELLEERALIHETLDATKIAAIREEMERAEAQRLQPHFIRSFFMEAFGHLGGRLHTREEGRWEVSRVPAKLKERDRLIGRGAPLLDAYERICFEKDHIDRMPVASFVCPGHPLLDATIDVTLEQYRSVLKQGAVLVDPSDQGDKPRVLFYLEHAVQDGVTGRDGKQRVISKRLQFVEIAEDGGLKDAGPAPYLDYRPLKEEETGQVEAVLDAEWLRSDLEDQVLSFAVSEVIPRHVEEIRGRRIPEIDKIEKQVRERLQKEINFWDHRAQELKSQEEAGKDTRLSSSNAQVRADVLADRLQTRLAELERERNISALPPGVRGGAIIIPVGILDPGIPDGKTPISLGERDPEVEQMAMNAVMAAERALGCEPLDVSAENRGWDIESKDKETGGLRFIEVKGRRADARTVTVTRNEILRALNVPDAYILAIVLVSDGYAQEPRYVRRPFTREPGWNEESVNFKLKEFLDQSQVPLR
ncbi:MAG: DUF3883 domain-containing protein [Rhodospirillaceae bacterium]|nr:DUF3883 domain-containing protein [Rhodospirillaceae bacterium]